MTIKEIRQLTKLTQSEFSKKYGIPISSLQNWEQGCRKCPDYVAELLEFVVKKDLCIGNVNSHNDFAKLEKPFLLIYSDDYESDCDFFETEEDLKKEAKEAMHYGYKIDCAIEIGSVRTIDFDETKADTENEERR